MLRDTKLMVGIIVNIVYAFIDSGTSHATQLSRIHGLYALILFVERTVYVSRFYFHKNMTRDDIGRDNAEIG